jgi:hypothetical protein
VSERRKLGWYWLIASTMSGGEHDGNHGQRAAAARNALTVVGPAFAAKFAYARLAAPLARNMIEPTGGSVISGRS